MMDGVCRNATAVVRLADLDDVDAVKHLADAHRREVGFVVRASLIAACKRHELFVAVWQGADETMPAETDALVFTTTPIIGFVQGYFRRDGQTTLHAIAVHPHYRRAGVGRALVSALVDASRERQMRLILLRCPIDLDANTFYRSLCFREERTEPGKRRELVVWAHYH